MGEHTKALSHQTITPWSWRIRQIMTVANEVWLQRGISISIPTMEFQAGDLIWGPITLKDDNFFGTSWVLFYTWCTYIVDLQDGQENTSRVQEWYPLKMLCWGHNNFFFFFNLANLVDVILLIKLAHNIESSNLVALKSGRTLAVGSKSFCSVGTSGNAP